MNIVGTWNEGGENGRLSPSLRFGALTLVLGNNVTVLENASASLIYEGTIFDRRPAELLSSQSALDTAFGLYSYVKISAKGADIVVGADRLGFSPWYYSMRGSAVSFSTSLTLAKYAAGRCSLDLEAWDELLNIGDIIGDKTTVREIRRLSPGSRMRLKNGAVSFESFWSPEMPEEANAAGYIRRNNELLAEALELTRGAPGSKIVLLSGGEDSRRIAVSAKAINLPVTFATQESLAGAKGDKNIITAGRVARYLDVPLHTQHLPSPETNYNDEGIRDYWLGFETDQHEWILPLLRSIPPGSLLYDGIAGDLAINASIFRSHRYPTLLHLYEDKDLDRIAETLCGAGPRFPIERSKLGSSLHERVREQLRAYPANSRRVAYFLLMNHARRNIGLQAQLYNLMGNRTCFPFLYYPLLMQSLSLDPKAQLEMRYQRACMEAVNPGIVGIPSTRDPLTDDILIDHAGEIGKREALAARRASLRPEIADLFPAFRLRLAAFEAASTLRIRPVTSRLAWMAASLSRMSDCLDWLEDSEIPEIPVRAEGASFLKRRLLRA